MPKAEKTLNKLTQDRYFTSVKRVHFYSAVGVIVLILLAVLLFVPHNKPLHYASDQELQQAHHDVIMKYFQQSTNCKDDNRSKDSRIQTFTKYFNVNQFANRAVVRGCNDMDTLYAKMDDGNWQPTAVNIVLSARQNPTWQKACLIDDITKADNKVRPENNSIDAHNLQVCDKLRKTSYIRL